jgi:hypothetical protein
MSQPDRLLGVTTLVATLSQPEVALLLGVDLPSVVELCARPKASSVPQVLRARVVFLEELLAIVGSGFRSWLYAPDAYLGGRSPDIFLKREDWHPSDSNSLKILNFARLTFPPPQ